MTESPSLLLRRAAERLEAIAGSATPGPWRVHDFYGETVVVGKPDESDKKTWRTVADPDLNPADAQWMEAVSPAVAAPLVAWLRKSAAHYDMLLDMAEGDVSWMEEWHTSPVVEFSRLVLDVSAEGMERSDPPPP